MPTSHIESSTSATDTANGGSSSQVVVICGAAGALGRALSLKIATTGAQLILLDKDQRGLNNLADEIEALGASTPYLFPVDLGGATPEDYERFADAVAENVGGVDCVIHCAAHFDGLMPLSQVPATQWWISLQANLSAPLLLTRALLPALKLNAAQSGQSSQVVFVLDRADTVAAAFWGAYGVANWGLRAMIQQMASEWSNLPLRILGLEVGPFRSALRARAFPAENPAERVAPENVAEQLLTQMNNQDIEPVIRAL